MEKGKYVELLLQLKISSFVALTFTLKANDTLNDLAFVCVCVIHLEDERGENEV